MYPWVVYFDYYRSAISKSLFFHLACTDLQWSDTEMDPCGFTQSHLQSQPASVVLFNCVSQQQATHGILNWPSDDTRLDGDPTRYPEQLGWNVTNAAADVQSGPRRSISLTRSNCHKWDGRLFAGTVGWSRSVLTGLWCRPAHIYVCCVTLLS